MLCHMLLIMQGDEDTEGSQDSPAANEKLPGTLSAAMRARKHIACLLPACCLGVCHNYATVSG